MIRKLEDLAGSVYMDTIDGLVKDENARKASIEERSIRVITTAGALAALLFAIAKFGGGGVLQAPDDTLLVLSLIFFVAAAILGLLANQPQHYEIVKDGVLHSQLDTKNFSDHDRVEAARLTTQDKLSWLLDARVKNGDKAWYLFFGLTFEVVAVICVAGAVAIVVDHNRTAVGLAVVAVIAFLVFLRVAFKAGPTLFYDRPARPTKKL